MSVSAVLCGEDVILLNLRDSHGKPNCRWIGRDMNVSDEICDLAKASVVIFLEVVKRANFSPFLLLPLTMNSTVLTLLGLL